MVPSFELHDIYIFCYITNIFGTLVHVTAVHIFKSVIIKNQQNVIASSFESCPLGMARPCPPVNLASVCLIFQLFSAPGSLINPNI